MSERARDWYAEQLAGEAYRLVSPDHLQRSIHIAGRHGLDGADALAWALTDLGHEPPPRPTEEEVRTWVEGLTAWLPEDASPPRPFVVLVRLREAAASDDLYERIMARAAVEMELRDA